MILPIYAFGQSVLKKKAAPIDKDYPDLDILLENMWETLYNAKGVGLAAPQIGMSIRLFLIDTLQLNEEDEKNPTGFKKAFINPQVLDEQGKPWEYEEGCLSIPDVRGDVSRPEQITIQYQDENFKTYTETFNGIDARVIQHEYDHIEGILFTEKLKPIKKRLIKRKLEFIKKGKVGVDYKMRFPRK